ncbi:MAG: transposase [Pseudomonadales bacterium]|nr:transposase [Pseudomonadales bacterium]
MPRQPRVNLPNVPQHIIQRGNNRHICFYQNSDYPVYLDKLKEYAQKYDVQIHAFVLMTNHVHLLMTPKTEQGISQLMQSLGRFYVRYINNHYNRTGTLWEGRYKAALVDTEHYFLKVSKYIELNPVRAKMVKHPASYPWSSYQGNALDKEIRLLTPHACYINLGNTQEKRKANYRALFNDEIDQYSIQQIREFTNKSWVLGSDKFLKQIEEQLGRDISIAKHGGDRRSQEFKGK